MSDKGELEKEFYSLAHAIQLLTDEREKASNQIHALKKKIFYYDDEIDELNKKIISVGEKMSKIQI